MGRARYRSSGSLGELVFVDLSPANTVPVGSTLQSVDGAPTRVLLPAEPLVLPPTWTRSLLEICCRNRCKRLLMLYEKFLTCPLPSLQNERKFDRLTGNIRRA